MVVAAADVAPWAAQGLGEEASWPRPSGDLSVQMPSSSLPQLQLFPGSPSCTCHRPESDSLLHHIPFCTLWMIDCLPGFGRIFRCQTS